MIQSIGALRFAAERHSEKVRSVVPKLTEIVFADFKKMKIAGASGNKNSWCSENQATFCQSANALLLSFFHGSSIRLKMEGNFLHRWGWTWELRSQVCLPPDLMSSVLNTPHYSKSQIFVQNSILQFFSGNQSCRQLRSANPQHFHEFFTQIFFW